ncbi:MAG: hypothetical protein IPG92_00155 [Flavobacteriales bacterium]|nr:hypothetical protein [Flavobacteriales bacterium]
MKRGLGNNRPNKAVLVVFTAGTPALVIDDNNSTEFWQKNFIDHKPKHDNVNSTSNLLTSRSRSSRNNSRRTTRSPKQTRSTY